MFWLAFRSGYASARANNRPSAPLKPLLGGGQGLHGGRVAGVGGRPLQSAHRLVAGLDHGFERALLVLPCSL